MNPRRPDDYPTAVVTVTLRDGRTLRETTTVVRGDAAAPIDHAELIAKFRALAGPILGDGPRRLSWTPSIASRSSRTSATSPPC